MHKRVTFNNKLLPYLLVAPQILITIIFFMLPAGQAVLQSVLQEDAFGISTKFIWFENFTRVLSDPYYINSVKVTVIFSLAVTFFGLSISLLLAAMADRVIHGAGAYKTFLIWPYAVAPAVAGVLWEFMFNPTVGVIAHFLTSLGYNWNYLLNGNQALFLVVLAACWNQISYNFIFFLAGLQSVPRSLIEAAAIDGAGPGRRFWTIILPMLSPTGFFLLVVNVVYAFFQTFGIVHVVTGGGPAKATEIMVFKVYNDSFRTLDLGGSAAQSVVLLLVVTALTVVQFRYVERRVHY